MKSKIVYVAILILCVFSVLLAGELSVYRYKGQNFTKEVQRHIQEIVENFEQK